MAKELEAYESNSALDWLESTSTDVDSVLILDGIGGLASPLEQFQLFPSRSSSPISHTRLLRTNSNAS